VDVDNDGWLDIFLVDSGSIADPRQATRARHRLYRNRGDGTFEDISGRAGLARRGYGMGACAADYDNDGAADIYVTAAGPNALYRGNGHGVFTDVTDRRTSDCRASGRAARSSIWTGTATWTCSSPTTSTPHATCSAAPHGQRARLLPSAQLPARDRVLYRNNGDGTFTDVSRAWGLLEHQGNGLGVVRDRLRPGRLARSLRGQRRHAQFPLPQREGHAFRGGRAAGRRLGRHRRAAAVRHGHRRRRRRRRRPRRPVRDQLRVPEPHALQEPGARLFVDTTLESGLRQVTRPFVGFGTAFADYDNDGDLDLAIVNGHVLDVPDAAYPKAVYAQRNLLLRNDGRGHFEDVSSDRVRVSCSRRSAARCWRATSTTTATSTSW
jgi:hypothetical protein